MLNAVVKRDPERLQAALTAFPDADTMTRYRLADAIALCVLNDQYGRQLPSAEIRVVTHKTAELENWICFEDEAGQTLRPSKARTWARRGHTPIVTVSGK